MATRTIRNIDTELKSRLRVRAAQNNRSMEAELRHILSESLGPVDRRGPDLADAIRRRFLAFGGVDDLQPHPPASVRPLPIGR